QHYQEAIRVDPNNAEALWKAAVQAVDLGEFNDAARDSMYRLGEQFARRAVQANPKSSMAHFSLAKSIGRRALSLGARERVKYAGQGAVRDGAAAEPSRFQRQVLSAAGRARAGGIALGFGELPLFEVHLARATRAFELASRPPELEAKIVPGVVAAKSGPPESA